MLPVSEKSTTRYFEGKPNRCEECSALVDWWSFVLNLIQDGSLFGHAFLAIGAREQVETVNLKPGERKRILFKQYGVPEDARLLYAAYTPQGQGVEPIVDLGRSPARHSIPSAVELFGAPPRFGDAPAECRVAIHFLWVPHGAGDETWQSLVEAFEAYGAGTYSAGVVSAHVAVEARLSRVINALFADVVAAGSVSRTKLKRFLSGAATYSHQLNVLLPTLVAARRLPQLPADVRGHLNRLRKARNSVMHEGRPTRRLEARDVAEMICAALFGFRYLEWVAALVDEQAEA